MQLHYECILWTQNTLQWQVNIKTPLCIYSSECTKGYKGQHFSPRFCPLILFLLWFITLQPATLKQQISAVVYLTLFLHKHTTPAQLDRFISLQYRNIQAISCLDCKSSNAVSRRGEFPFAFFSPIQQAIVVSLKHKMRFTTRKF